MSGNETKEFFLIFVFPLFTYLSQVIIQMNSEVSLYCVLFTDYPISSLLTDVLVTGFSLLNVNGPGPFDGDVGDALKFGSLGFVQNPQRVYGRGFVRILNKVDIFCVALRLTVVI